MAIVGSGFAGLGMAIRLQQAGIEDFVVLERADDVGGTWRDNTYPGCACDVPSHLYSFSFAPNPELDAHLLAAARDLGLPARLRATLRRHAAHPLRPRAAGREPGTRTTSAGTSRPRTATLTAEVLVLGHGAAERAVDPATCRASSASRARRSTRRTWDHDHDLDGERVAVIGTGASAIQFVPQIQPEVGQLHLFQRTPPWIMPRPDRPLTGLRAPAVPRAAGGPAAHARGHLLGARERSCSPSATRAAMRWGRARSRCATCTARSPIPSCARKLTPDYRMGCKRILLSNDYYPALGAAERRGRHRRASREVRERSIVTADGTEREVDTIIFGTGFHVTDMPAAERVRGARRAHAGRGLGRQPAGLPRHDRRRLPEPLPAARPEHRPRAQLGGLHDRGAGRLRRSTPCASWRRARRGRARGPARGAGAPTTRASRSRCAAPCGRRRLRELVPRRQGPQHDAVARLHLALPPSARAVRPRALRAARATAGARARGRLTARAARAANVSFLLH